MSRLVVSLGFVALCTMPSSNLAADRAIPVRAATLVVAPGWRLVAAEDLDGNGSGNLAFLDSARRTLRVFEEVGDRLSLVGNVRFDERAQYAVSGDVDGDGYPEIVLRGVRSGDVLIVEAAGPRDFHTRSLPVPVIHAATFIGDSDGNGRLEILAGQSSFPSRLHRLEGIADDQYRALSPLEGGGGEIRPAYNAHHGLVAFIDTHFWLGIRRLRVWDRGRLRAAHPRVGMFPQAIGDVDGNGNPDIVGIDGLDTVVFELTGDSVHETYRGQLGQCRHAALLDIDGDGRPEIPCIEHRAVVWRAPGRDVDVAINEGTLAVFPGRVRLLHPAGGVDLAVEQRGRDLFVHLMR